MNISLPYVLAYIVNIAVLYVLLRALLYKPVIKFLDERKERVSHEQEMNAQEKERLLKQKADYDALMENSAEQSNAIIQQGKQAAAKRSEEIINEARQQAEQLHNQAEKEIEDERRAAQRILQQQAAELVAQMAAKVLEREVSSQDSHRVVEEFLSQEGIE